MEILSEDPTAMAYVQVGEELVRRRRWAEAAGVLARGVRGTPMPEASALLARACVEVGQYHEALVALEAVDVDPKRSPSNAQLFVLALERAGRHDLARARAEEFLALEPTDVVVRSVLERLDRPATPQGGQQRGADPFYTVTRAEMYVQCGRVDRAIRTYRRILLYNNDNDGLRSRLRQLTADDAALSDDLSQDLVDPASFPAQPEQTPQSTFRRLSQADFIETELLEVDGSDEPTEPGHRGQVRR
ncbi:MAG: tetratricopeptide repeat protein [Myxococcales bacterium]|nr:tetratricopeptide repeat protein [Myxococcales bacterium]